MKQTTTPGIEITNEKQFVTVTSFKNANYDHHGVNRKSCIISGTVDALEVKGQVHDC
jgi:hypothetical protein